MMDHLAIVISGLSENWLGGVNYYRNLVSAFDDASCDKKDLHLHVLTDDGSFFNDLGLSERVTVHQFAMLRRKSPAWVLRKTMLVIAGRDVMLLNQLARLRVRVVVFSHVTGAKSAGIYCAPWIPDFQSRRHPEYFQAETVLAERRRDSNWIADSSALIVSSLAARDDAVKLYRTTQSRVNVLRFAPRIDAVPLLNREIRQAVFAKYNIDRPYIFLPNQYWKHKNHGIVIRAMRQLLNAGHEPPLVVSTGKTLDSRDPDYFPSFASEVHSSGLSNHYRILGVVERKDMLVLLAHSVAVLNPSRFEGWSTSIEEAKALNKPVIASSIPVHVEQLQNWPQADLFGVDDVADLAALLIQYRERGDEGFDAHLPSHREDFYRAFVNEYLTLMRTFVSRALLQAEDSAAS